MSHWNGYAYDSASATQRPGAISRGNSLTPRRSSRPAAGFRFSTRTPHGAGRQASGTAPTKTTTSP